MSNAYNSPLQRCTLYRGRPTSIVCANRQKIAIYSGFVHINIFWTQKFFFDNRSALLSSFFFMSGQYETGIFECMSDCNVCLYGCVCMECLMSQNWARSRSEECTIWHCCAPVFPMWTRINIKKMLGSTENNYCGDCCTYFCCFPCAVCQDARQLNKLDRS